MAKFREMLKEAGRDRATLPDLAVRRADDLDTLKRYRDLGVVRACVSLAAAKGGALCRSWTSGRADPRSTAQV